MILTDVLRAAALASIPALAATKMLSIWWIYVVAFVTAALSVRFTLAQAAAVPSLVDRDDLVAANGRIQASYSAAAIAGPALAGDLAYDHCAPLLRRPLLPRLCWFACAPWTQLQRHPAQAKAPIHRGSADGLRYVLRQPVVRAIAALAAIANFLIPTIRAQLVLFADQRFQVNPIQLNWCYASGPIGTRVFSLLAGRVSWRFAFSRIVLGSSAVHQIINELVIWTKMQSLLDENVVTPQSPTSTLPP